jgi:hypothetical protein
MMKTEIFNFRNVFKAIFFSLILMSAGCYKDNEKTLYPSDCNTDNVSFSQTITPIINNNCVSCHSGVDGSGGISLANYADIVSCANSGKLLGAIKHESGFQAMPQGGSPLSDCSISQVEAWIQQGTPNN